VRTCEHIKFFAPGSQWNHQICCKMVYTDPRKIVLLNLLQDVCSIKTSLWICVHTSTFSACSQFCFYNSLSLFLMQVPQTCLHTHFLVLESASGILSGRNAVASDWVVMLPMDLIHQQATVMDVNRWRQNVSIFLGYRLDDAGFDLWQWQELFLFSKASGLSLGPTQCPVQWMPGTLSLGIKWPKCEVDHSIPLMQRLRMSGAMPLVSLYAFMAWKGTSFTLIYRLW
jgi:hypothetical protein